MPRSTCALFAATLCAAMAIAGCGGGGGSTATTPPTGDSNNPTPSLASATPSSATAGAAATQVTLAGSGFISSSAIQWNGTALTTTFVSSSSLQATIPASDLADGTTAKLTVESPTSGGGTSAVVSFTVNNPVPAITSITPTNATSGSPDLLITINGSGFVPSTVVNWNAASLKTTFINTTQLTTTLPAADLATASEATITAQNPAPSGGTSPGVKFDIKGPAPLIQSIAPRILPPGSPATTITVTGTGFVSTSVVLWNTSPRPTTFVSATQLKVVLSATDLQLPQLGMLQVSNGGAAPSPSAPIGLAVSSQPLPTIQSASFANGNAGVGTFCPQQLSVTVVGSNIGFGTVIQANAVSLQTYTFQTTAPQQIVGYLPVGFTAAPGALSLTVTTTGGDGVALTSDPYAYPANAPAALSLCATPTPASVFPASNFTFTIQPTEVNISGNGTVTLGTLPTGVTSTASSITVPPAGAAVHLKAAGTLVIGNYDLTFKGTAGTASASSDFPFSVVSSASQGFTFVPPIITPEIGVPIGGSGSVTYGTEPPLISGYIPVIFDVTPSVSALPPGTTATFSPATFTVGQTVTVTLTAAANAPVTKNVAITLTGTPSAPIPAATTQFFADVTQPPGSLADSRTDFVGTEGTPYGAAFDPTHNLIFSSDPDWNRIEVISNTTHKIVKTIPVRSPRGIDIAPDFKHVWVQTASPQIYEIDTTTLQATHYTLPSTQIQSTGLPPVNFGIDTIFALSNGNVFLYFGDSGNTAQGAFGVWNPQANNFPMTSTPGGLARRSGDGSHVFVCGTNTLTRYDAGNNSVVTVGSIQANSTIAGVNSDGSRIVLGFGSSQQLYDGNLNLLGVLPGIPPFEDAQFRVVFSADNTKLYEIVGYDNVYAVLTVDVATLKVLGVAPAETSTLVAGYAPSGVANPFAIDSTGMLLGTENYGVTFDDATFYQNYSTSQPSLNSGITGPDTYSGPLSGGTVVSVNAVPTQTPDVWFGPIRGSANISTGLLTFTSPPSTTPGPVNVKFIYPDGQQAFFPEMFTYGVFPEFAVLSGSSPSGGAPGSVVGFGLPQDVSGGSVTVDGNQATITTMQGQYPPLIGDGTNATVLNYTFPPGNPGRADLQITTPNGSGSLPKSVVYAKSVTDYSSADTFAAVLFDAKRNQVYLAAGDHVDVFSTSTNQFVTSLHPAAQGATKQFAGMALTPDGSQLLVTDVNDGSLAVIDPDSPSNTFAIPVYGATGDGCIVGPIYVAATSTHLAFVQTGSLPHPSCPQSGNTFQVNLLARTAVQTIQCESGIGVDASADGNFVVLGGPPCIYSAATSTYTQGAFPGYNGDFGVSISGDGNVLAESGILGDLNLNMLGSIPQPPALHDPNQPTPQVIYFDARLNASGSLYFTPYQHYFEIVDVAHGTLRMRFSLTENVNEGLTPLAIDGGGRFVYLTTDQGLTVVDFGEAPLSIGHLSQTNAAVGSQVTVRGSGFDSTVSATVGGVAATVSFTDENTLTLTIPATPSGPQDIVLTRTGAYAESYTLENGVVLP